MSKSILDALLESVNVESNIVPFLKYSGWSQAENDNPRWIVMHGGHDAEEQPFELVFPAKANTSDAQPYIVKAVELLTALRSEPMQLVVQSVIKYDRDIFYVRNVDTDENAISLDLAASQISNLRKTIEYSICVEREVKPYFNEPTSMARRVVKDFLFGHTIAGSFGFTVEAPRLPDPPEFVQPKLPEVDDDEPLPVPDVPFTRRVVERIARGLLLTKQAQQDRDHTVLVNEYASGFNSNMCASVANMSSHRMSAIEFRITWSPKIVIDDDVTQNLPAEIREPGYAMLKDVAERLKKTKPDYVEIVGYVRALTTNNNPQNLGTRRAIVVRGQIPTAKRVTDVIVELDLEDYLKAHDAHMKWRNVAVDGILARSGVGWRLLNPRNFRMIRQH